MLFLQAVTRLLDPTPKASDFPGWSREKFGVKDATVYKYHLLAQQAGGNQAFSSLRRLKWIQAVGNASVSAVVEKICWVLRGP